MTIEEGDSLSSKRSLVDAARDVWEERAAKLGEPDVTTAKATGHVVDIVPERVEIGSIPVKRDRVWLLPIPERVVKVDNPAGALGGRRDGGGEEFDTPVTKGESVLAPESDGRSDVDVGLSWFVGLSKRRSRGSFCRAC